MKRNLCSLKSPVKVLYSRAQCLPSNGFCGVQNLSAFHTSGMQLSNSKEFNEAVHNLDHLKSVDNPTKLRLYALYKQATVGKNEKKKPGFTDIVGRVKF